MLLSKAPNKLFIFDYEFEIITNARVWLNISYNFNIVDLLKTVKNIDIIQENDTIERKKIIDRLVEKLIWFLNCGENIDNEEPLNNKKLYDFKIDDAVIFSAFYRTYKINIEKEIDKMHWWWFMSLFNDLSKETTFKSYYIYYRNYDISNKDFQKLPIKEKNEIIKIINKVSLGVEKREKPKSELAKRREKAQREKQLKEISNG